MTEKLHRTDLTQSSENSDRSATRKRLRQKTKLIRKTKYFLPNVLKVESSNMII